MKKMQKGSFTIEAAVVIPMLLFAIGVIMMLLFYCHDKNVLEGAASEAAVVASGRTGKEKYDSLVEGKLLWLRNPKIKVEEKEDHIVVTAEAGREIMEVQVQTKVAITKPETFIRNVRKLENTIGGNDEDILSDGFE